ncbi:MAG: HAMP domain-containing sensor histidine kinase [Candidatus Gastranaerophilales bacterium]|nr:HAMP domain-containing sensor histidine kinase [Candidatus Gastranaerophilales bacterium]
MKLNLKTKLIFIYIFTIALLLLINLLIVNHYTKQIYIEHEDEELVESMELCQNIYLDEIQLQNFNQLDIEMKDFNFQVQYENGKVVYSSPKIKTKKLSLKYNNVYPFFYNKKWSDGKEYRFYLDKKNISGIDIYFVTYISLTDELEFINEITVIIALLFIVSCIIIVLISVFFVNRAFTPVEKIINNISETTITNLDQKLKIESNNDILEKLFETYNYMRKRLGISFTSIKQFISDFSHEIKNPLSVIKSGIELTMKQPYIKEKEINVLQRTINEVDSINRMINEMLLLTRADADSLVLNLKKIKIKEIVEFVSDIGRIMVSEKQIEFKTENKIKNIQINIDEQKIKQIFINLLNNAVEYTQQGNITVMFQKNSDQLIFTVSDTGIGISPEELEKIFQRFYRVDKIRARENKHFGLGLSIVKTLVELHNGTISVKSEINKGTSIKISIPFF